MPFKDNFQGINKLALFVNIDVYCSSESSKNSRNCAANLKISSVFNAMTHSARCLNCFFSDKEFFLYLCSFFLAGFESYMKNAVVHFVIDWLSEKKKVNRFMEIGLFQ